MASSVRKLPVKTILRMGLVVYGAVSIVLSQPIRALAHENAIAEAVKYCRHFAGLIGLNEDKTILCFDAKITPGQEFASIPNLMDGGMFVIRSPGGSSSSRGRAAGCPAGTTASCPPRPASA